MTNVDRAPFEMSQDWQTYRLRRYLELQAISAKCHSKLEPGCWMLFGRYNTAPTPMLPNWPAQEVVFLEVAVHERQTQIGARNVDAGKAPDYRT